LSFTESEFQIVENSRFEDARVLDERLERRRHVGIPGNLVPGEGARIAAQIGEMLGYRFGF
jgi:hypothetical protein